MVPRLLEIVLVVVLVLEFKIRSSRRRRRRRTMHTTFRGWRVNSIDVGRARPPTSRSGPGIMGGSAREYARPTILTHCCFVK
jgi:hypothetical protein